MSQSVVNRLRAEVIDPMKQRFVGRDEVVDLIALAIVAGEHLFLFGPPGTAKSALIRTFAGGMIVKRPPSSFAVAVRTSTRAASSTGIHSSSSSSSGATPISAKRRTSWPTMSRSLPRPVRVSPASRGSR